MSGLIYFILGAVVSIPITVLGPFATNRIQQLQGERNSRHALKRKSQLVSEKVAIQRFVDNSAEFTHYLLSRVLFITLVTALTGIFPALISAFAQGMTAFAQTADMRVTRIYFDTQEWLFTVAAFFGVVSAIIIISLANRAIRVYFHVSHYEDYIKFIDSEISRLHIDSSNSSAPDAAES